MENLFPLLTQFIREGLTPMLTMLVNWLMDDSGGLFLGLKVIALPLLGSIILIFRKLKRK